MFNIYSILYSTYQIEILCSVKIKNSILIQYSKCHVVSLCKLYSNICQLKVKSYTDSTLIQPSCMLGRKQDTSVHTCKIMWMKRCRVLWSGGCEPGSYRGLLQRCIRFRAIVVCRVGISWRMRFIVLTDSWDAFLSIAIYTLLIFSWTSINAMLIIEKELNENN